MIFKAGMKVRIPEKLYHTENTVSVNGEMRGLVGTIQTIERLDQDILIIRGWSWSRLDFINQLKPVKQIPIQHFDPKELVV